jgi:hypothetical protein
MALLDLFPSMGPAMNEAAGASKVMRRVIDHRIATRAESAVLLDTAAGEWADHRPTPRET